LAEQYKPRLIIWARHVAHVGKKENSYRAFVTKPGRKKHFEVLGVDGGDDIKMDFQEIEWDGLYWIYRLQNVDQCRDFMNTVMNLRVSCVCVENFFVG
jgi:hypothetical protein